MSEFMVKLRSGELVPPEVAVMRLFEAEELLKEAQQKLLALRTENELLKDIRRQLWALKLELVNGH